jgi:asparagine synthase (glutamine-hydrolysing)
MNAAAPHRGDRGETIVRGRCVLSTVVSDEFDDAGIATSGRITAAFAGSLDNVVELAAELRLRGSDGEHTPEAVVAAGFAAWGGRRLAERMRGTFTAAVTDGEQLFCFRDQVGFGSLFYRLDERGVFLATEPKQVVAGAEMPRKPDLDVLEQTFFETYDAETPSALQGVQRVPKGTLLGSDGHGIDRTRYWDPEALLETGKYSDAELETRFVELMDQAVTRCLAGNDAILLSGGVDSSAIAAFAAPRHLARYGGQLAAITGVYPRYASVDEQPYTILVAERLGIPLHTWEPHSDALEGVEEWVRLTDGPVVAGSLALYADAYRVARELGHRTVLSGEFAEFVCTLNDYLLDHLLSHGRLRASARHLSMRRSAGAPWTRLARELAAALSPAAVRAARSRTTGAGIPAWIDRRKANEAAATSLVGPRKRWSTLQLSPFTGPGSSVEAEEICQALSGVRARRPFADVDLWAFFLSLRADTKFPDLRGKSLLRRLLRGRVPDEILDRTKKTVFDDAILANIDYSTLRRLLLDSAYRMEGVDYKALGERLHREEIGIVDYKWVMRLAAVHAFLSSTSNEPSRKDARVIHV